jgi:hypothetical protein
VSRATDTGGATGNTAIVIATTRFDYNDNGQSTWTRDATNLVSVVVVSPLGQTVATVDPAGKISQVFTTPRSVL